MGRRVGRPKAGQELLNRERIVEVALQLVDADGLDALTMRRLADALGVDPMAIYRHLPNKQAVIAGLVSRVFAGLRVPAASDRSWQERVQAFAEAYRAVARAHPNLVLQIVADPAAATAGALQASEELYAALEAAGLSSRSIVYANGLIVDYVNGFVLAEASGGGPQPPGAETTDEAQIGAPTMRRVLAQAGPSDSHESFRFGLDVIIAGIERIAERERPAV